MDDGTVVEHVYDAEGNRMQTKVTPPAAATLTTKFLVDTVGRLSHVVAETTTSEAFAAFYLRLEDQLLAEYC